MVRPTLAKYRSRRLCIDALLNSGQDIIDYAVQCVLMRARVRGIK